MKLKMMIAAVKLTANRGGLVLRKHSPEIMVGMGIVGLVTSTVLACRQTMKAEDVITEFGEKIQKIERAAELASLEDYSEADQKKDKVIAYTQTAVDFIKLYSGPVALGIVSVGLILNGHHILKKRHVALLGAYKSLEEGFKGYRKRVIEEFGEKKDFDYQNGIYADKVMETQLDAKGKEHEVEVLTERYDPNHHSQYARFFDETSLNWTKTPENNLLFVRAQQNYANNLLKSRGHIFLNEVYDMLGLERSQAGAVVGWVLGKDGDNFVDFGIYDFGSDAARAFVNGQERSILLDFNVNGVMYDLI